MVYAGGAYVKGKARVSYVDEVDPEFSFSEKEGRDGFRLSVGFEQQLVRNFFLKGEYRYLNYDNYTYTEGTESISLGFDRHQVVAGLGARF
jgi:outer membrane immunogenic protein